ncbi:amidoligase family protein [Ruminococcus sp.]|uniref:amidoligase family protein n=1 Tax=Ruminococcus sp. TaxID=41978 RepID=UPI0025F127D5|nr:amidoligase family protein [Ruminococcus sp.]
MGDENLSGNFDGIKTQKFGVEIECTGLTRNAAARAIGRVFDSVPEHFGGSYDKYHICDSKDRKWAVVYDSSIRRVDKNGGNASREYAVEIVTPVLEYSDIPLLQEIVRAVRRAGGIFRIILPLRFCFCSTTFQISACNN